MTPTQSPQESCPEHGGRAVATPWFSHADAPVDQPVFCLVCWGHGGVITRHRGPHAAPGR
jgi:hypothetical protein